MFDLSHRIRFFHGFLLGFQVWLLTTCEHENKLKMTLDSVRIFGWPRGV